MKLKYPTVGPIVGYTTPNSSRIWFRGHFEATGESSYRRCFGFLHYRKKGSTQWLPPLVNKMSPNFDMTCVLAPTDLEPDTEYEYQTGWLLQDSEIDPLASLGNPLFQWPEQIHSFKTTLADDQTPRTYVVGSCRYLLKTFIGEIFDDRGDKAFRSILGQHRKKAIDGLVMMGDQIYADDLAFIAPDTKLTQFLRRYRTVFSQEHVQALMARVPTYMILDDHEIEDNWPASADHEDWVTLYPHAIHAYQIYQCSHSPLFYVDKDGRINGSLEKFWYHFSDGCLDWFVMDTRTERQLTEKHHRMVSPGQLDALLQWLNDGSDRVKMIVTSVPMMPDMDTDDADKWGAFPTQREAILDAVAAMPNPRVVFVSGDVHCSFAAALLVKGRTKPIAYQVVSSAFFWPYPHTKKSDFNFGDLKHTGYSPGQFRTKLLSKVLSDDNFTRLDISPKGGAAAFFHRKGDKLGQVKFTF